MEQRLIDANALKGYLRIALMVTEPLAKEQPDIGELIKTLANGFITQVDAMPTIEAIPVEWILNNEKMPKDGKGRKAIMDMIEDWRDGNE